MTTDRHRIMQRPIFSTRPWRTLNFCILLSLVLCCYYFKPSQIHGQYLFHEWRYKRVSQLENISIFEIYLAICINKPTRRFHLLKKRYCECIAYILYPSNAPAINRRLKSSNPRLKLLVLRISETTNKKSTPDEIRPMRVPFLNFVHSRFSSNMKSWRDSHNSNSNNSKKENTSIASSLKYNKRRKILTFLSILNQYS